LCGNFYITSLVKGEGVQLSINQPVTWAIDFNFKQYRVYFLN
jgi:hypothetical protein